jgi:MFS family permease
VFNSTKVFGELYFPESDPLVGTLQTFGIYAVGFASRPIGAAIFGHYGDRIGRKAALIGTLLLTGLAKFAVRLHLWDDAPAMRVDPPANIHWRPSRNRLPQ